MNFIHRKRKQERKNEGERERESERVKEIETLKRFTKKTCTEVYNYICIV